MIYLLNEKMAFESQTILRVGEELVTHWVQLKEKEAPSNQSKEDCQIMRKKKEKSFALLERCAEVIEIVLKKIPPLSRSVESFSRARSKLQKRHFCHLCSHRKRSLRTNSHRFYFFWKTPRKKNITSLSPLYNLERSSSLFAPLVEPES